MPTRSTSSNDGGPTDRRQHAQTVASQVALATDGRPAADDHLPLSSLGDDLKMGVPDLLPGEWLEGYLGRLAILNGESTRSSLEAALRSWLESEGRAPRRTTGLVPPVAVATWLPIGEISAGYTTWPALHATDRPTGNDFFVRRFEAQGWKSMFRRLRYHEWLCPDCVASDVSKCPFFSYWRRDHQLPGHLWCVKHSSPLMFLENESSFLEL